jgi:hypothetical protein
MLARYILYSKWVREDQTVRPDAFIPHPYPDLSVTRHEGISEAQIWQFGLEVAREVQRPLYGRADVSTRTIIDAELQVKPDPTDSNPNHAIIVGWPLSKAEQKCRAQKVAADSRYMAAPTI